MSSMKTWFVQTGFGATLGPMPDDALREMVRTGALVPEDHVREGLTGEWRSASEIVGLFETPASPTLAAMTLDESVDDSSSRRPPELPEDLLDDHKLPVPPVSLAATANQKSPTLGLPSLWDQASAPGVSPQRNSETTRQMLDRWWRSLPHGAMVAGLAVLLVAMWWFWPSSQRGLYKRYVAIWSEWKTRRVDGRDTAEWQDFLQRTKSELDESIPWLEKHVRATDHGKMLLLHIGRDCLRPMLKRPRDAGSIEERHLINLLASAQEYYDRTGTPIPRQAFIGATSAPSPRTNAQPPNKSAIQPQAPASEVNSVLPFPRPESNILPNALPAQRN